MESLWREQVSGALAATPGASGNIFSAKMTRYDRQLALFCYLVIKAPLVRVMVKVSREYVVAKSVVVQGPIGSSVVLEAQGFCNLSCHHGAQLGVSEDKDPLALLYRAVAAVVVTAEGLAEPTCLSRKRGLQREA